MIRILKVVIAIEIIIIGAAYFVWRRIRSNVSFGSSNTIFKAEGITGRPPISILFKEEMKLSMDQLEIHTEKRLGSGHFSNVYEATLRTELGQFVKAAVKIPHPSATSSELNKFMKEPGILQHLSSNHVVKLLGVVIDNSHCLFVLEYLAFKDLKSFLTELKKRVNSLLPTQTLIRMACEAADGMAYLDSQNLVHTDLAARNCLVGGDNRNLKISDLGLAGPPEEFNTNEEERLECLPVRWMAPESLKNKIFTTKSDVWSYGVLLWEMSTGGKTPYEEIGHDEITQNVIREGCSLSKPVLSIPPFESVMVKCWHCSPAHRPSFSAIFTYLLEFLEHGRERELIMALSYCTNQQKLLDERVFSLNEREESFLTWEEREPCLPLGQCPLGGVSCKGYKNKLTPPRSSGINLDNSKEITNRIYSNLGSNSYFPHGTVFSSVPDPKPCHSRTLTSFHEDPSESGIAECPQDQKGVRRPPQRVKSACSIYYNIPSKEKAYYGNRTKSDLKSRKLSLKFNIKNAKESVEMTKHSMIESLTERCLPFSSNTSHPGLSPFKVLTDHSNLSSRKKHRFFDSDDSESSANLISPSESLNSSIVKCKVSTTRHVSPFIRSSVPFVGSALPVYYCQCPREAEPTFEHRKSSSMASDNDNRNTISDFPSLHNPQNLISLHQKHLSREARNESRPSLLASERKYI